MLDMKMHVRPILLVEDNPMDLDLTCQALKEHSVANPIAICRDGEEALQYMEEHPLASDSRLPILVLLDLRLPKVDGIEVLRQARNLCVGCLIEAVRSANKTIDIDNVNRVLLQPHWQKETALVDF